MKRRDQSGINMVGLIVWSFLAIAVMGGVVALFVSTSHQTAIGAEQNQQQQSILNALNRTSRDIAVSNPIIYASDTEIVLDVTTEDGNVERRRYELNVEDKKVYEYSKKIKRGDTYNVDVWSSADRKASTVYNVDTSNLVELPFLKYYDKNSTALGGDFSTPSATEGIARVDISLTAEVANKGKVSLSTSAVPRSTSHLGGDAAPALPTCPAFTVTRDGENVVMRWDKASGGVTGYEITRNGLKITSVKNDAAKLKYTYTDTPGSVSTVINYMLKVVSPSGITNCIDSVTPVTISATSSQLTAEVLPTSEYDDATGAPVSTAWSSATETTTVKLNWQKVRTASGYVLYKQRLDKDGVPQGQRVTIATLETYPYVDLNSTTLAPNDLSHTVDAGWDEYWEWSIKVLSRSGDNDNTPSIRTLSYPYPLDGKTGDPSHPDTTLSVTAVPLSGPGAVSSSDIAAGKGVNKLTWTYTAGPEARGFDIYRSALDAPAANFPSGFTKIASVEPGVTEYRDSAAFGSTYGYYVIAKNKSGFSNPFASKRVEQLQFPPDPQLISVSPTGSRDLNDGTNRVMWKQAKSASGYHVWRTNTLNNSTACLTGNCSLTSGGLSGVTSSYDDSSTVIKPATRFSYVAYSYNATGLSPKLAASVVLTQRPSAPVLSKTASPTLKTTRTSMKWTVTSGSWCVSGAYTGKSGSAACEYEQKQFKNDGSVRYTAHAYATSLDWGNQEWGRHYTYSVRARNAAIFKGGWSAPSGKIAADTYPGPVNVNVWNGNSKGTNKQRINYDSKVDVGGWGNVRQAGYTTLSWGQALGSSKIDIVRIPDANQKLSADKSLLLPSISKVAGTLRISNGNIAAGTWQYIAAPGTQYSYNLVATAIENPLKRSISSGKIYTPADIPQKGAVQVVCKGPDNYDPTGNLDHPAQKIATRTAYTDFAAKYGYYEWTAVEKLYSPTKESGVKSNGWVKVGKGKSGNGIQSSSGVGYFKYIENGFNFINRAANRTDSATLQDFNVYVIYPFSKCPPASSPTLQEPADACYGITAAGCTALNPDNRPRWTSR